MAFTTTLKDIATKALEFHGRGMLGYQSAENRKTEACLYLYEDGRRCAIGAGLPEDLSTIFGENKSYIGASVGVLLDIGDLVIADDYNIYDRLSCDLAMSSSLQARHDALMDISDDRAEFKLKEDTLLFVLNELASGRRPTFSKIEAKIKAMSKDLGLTA